MVGENTIRLSMDSIREMVLFYDEKGTITYANASAEQNLSYKDGLVGHSIIDVYPSVFRVEAGSVRIDAMTNKDEFNTDAYRENRTCFPVYARITEQNGVCMVMGIDISNSDYLARQVEQVAHEAEEAAKVKSEFVANVTHELRTPVNGILGNTLELKDMEDAPEKLRVLALIERGCADMNAIINNILDFSKLEAGKFTLEKREFNFREMMDYVKSNHKIKIADKGLDFVMNIASDIPDTIIGDELRIVQVLNNLISNACKFTTIGRISVEVVKTSVRDNRMELFFLVIDSGIGIAPEDQDKLFQSFSQVDASISRKFGGTGLGLNICKQLVELMNGTIHVESTAGKGSTFSFHIWVDIPEGEMEKVSQLNSLGETQLREKAKDSPITMTDIQQAIEIDEVRTYGTEENLKEIERKLNKLILCVEMDNWEKAETFVVAVRELTENAPKDVKNTALRLKMAVQKEDYDKASTGVTNLRELLNDEG